MVGFLLMAVNIIYASGKATPEVTFAFRETVSQDSKEHISKSCKKWEEERVYTIGGRGA